MPIIIIIIIVIIIEVLAVYQSGEAEADPRPDVLLVAQTNLTRVVYLGPQAAALLQVILEAHTEARRVTGGCPAEVNTRLNVGLHLAILFMPDSPMYVHYYLLIN